MNICSEEIWKDIKDYEGLYQVSNLGRVKRVEHKRCDRNQLYKEKLIKLQTYKCGYLYVGLWKNSKRKHHRVHRLVAEAFMPNPNNYPVINHIDSNIKNNNVNNLEWCTQSHNIKESFRLGRKISPKTIQVLKIKQNASDESI